MRYFPTIVISVGITLLGILIYHNFRSSGHVSAIAERNEVGTESIYLQPVDYQVAIQSGNTDLVHAASTALPAVVYIRSVTSVDYNNKKTSYTSSNGSGVIVSSDGFIVTNRHLIDQGSSIEVVLNNRREYKAEIIGTDRSTDLALLKIEAVDLPDIRFANSNSLEVGQWVIAVGNPFKLQSTVTAGIISALARDIPFSTTGSQTNAFIQTDAVVNKGNSGGALVSEAGELIGINSAILTQSGRFEGYSFAIPSNLVLKVIEDLREYGVVQRGELGIKGISVNADLADAKRLGDVNGVYIDEVLPNSAAHIAGIKAGDIVIKINDTEIHTLPELNQKLAMYRPGDVVRVLIFRNQKELVYQVRLKNKLNTVENLSIEKSSLFKELGIEVRNMTAEEMRNTSHRGIKVISVITGSKIARTKMDPGFIITKINNEPVINTDMCEELLDSMEGRIMLEGFYEEYEGAFWYVFTK